MTDNAEEPIVIKLQEQGPRAIAFKEFLACSNWSYKVTDHPGSLYEFYITVEDAMDAYRLGLAHGELLKNIPN